MSISVYHQRKIPTNNKNLYFFVHFIWTDTSNFILIDCIFISFLENKKRKQNLRLHWLGSEGIFWYRHFVYKLAHGGVIGDGLCIYDMTTALTLSMNDDSTYIEKKLDKSQLEIKLRKIDDVSHRLWSCRISLTCFASSLARELAKLIHEQYNASHAK